METIQYKQSPFQKIRLGNQSTDGGYILCDIPNLKYSLLLGGGVGYDITFEEDFVSNYCPGIEAHVFDASVDGLPWGYEDVPIQFHKQFIGTEDTDEYTTLKQYLNTNQTGIFVKMDIEGAEFAWLDCLSDEDLSKIDQLVIEFHFPWKTCFLQETIQRLYKIFYLFHFHDNNAEPPILFGGVNVPEVFELTLVNKKHCEGMILEGNKDPIPCGLDRPNILSNKTYSFSGPPYTF